MQKLGTAHHAHWTPFFIVGEGGAVIRPYPLWRGGPDQDAECLLPTLGQLHLSKAAQRGQDNPQQRTWLAATTVSAIPDSSTAACV